MAATESGLVAIAGASGQVLLVDLVSERVLFELQLRSVAPHLAFSPSGLQLGTGEISGRFSIWSVESGEVVGGFGFKVAIVSLAVDESGEVWIYGRVDGTTVVWDL
ncbi:WD40 repeat domain-containing protein [bacterium]|nr:WD40 repeat domain-containing protein [bacterium]